MFIMPFETMFQNTSMRKCCSLTLADKNGSIDSDVRPRSWYEIRLKGGYSLDECGTCETEFE